MRKALVCAILLLALSAGAAPPALTTAGIVHAASFAPVADRLPPGGIISLFGTGLARSAQGASGGSLPIVLNGTRVMIGDVPAPLFYVSSNQINLQVPVDLRPDAQVSIQVFSSEGEGASVRGTVARYAPGIFTAASTGYGLAVATHPDGGLVNSGRPTRSGDTIVIYATGLGATRTPVASGAAASEANPADIPVQVVVGGRTARVQYAGLTPGFVGLYQINAQVPDGYLPGDPLIVSQGGQLPGNAGTVPVVQANQTLLGDIPENYGAKLLPFPEGAPALAPPVFQGGDRFIAFEAGSNCNKGFWVYQFRTSDTATPVSAPDGVACISRLLMPVGAGREVRQMAAALDGEAPSPASGLVLFNMADGSAELRKAPAGVSAQKFEAGSLNVYGSQVVAHGRTADGSGGAGLLLHDFQNNTFRTIPQPEGGAAPFYGGPMFFDNASATIYTGGGTAAAGPFDQLVAVRLRPVEGKPPAEIVAPPAGLSGGLSTGRAVQIPRQRVLLALTRDGATYHVRTYNLEAGGADSTPMPSSFTPVVGAQNQAPEFLLVAERNLLYALGTRQAGSSLVHSIFVVDLQNRTVSQKNLPAGVTDISQISELGGTAAGTLLALANSDANGGAKNLLLWDPTATTPATLYALPSGVAAIGRGQAGKSGVLGAQSRPYTVIGERQVVLAFASMSDPAVADAGLAAFDLRSNSAQRLALPAGSARLSETGGFTFKAATNKVFVAGETAGQDNANQLVWFDLAANRSGLVGGNQTIVIRNVAYNPPTGMAIVTTRSSYVVLQLP